MTGLRKVQFSQNGHYAKLPPQAIELEEQLIGICLTHPDLLQLITFLKPEHFYKDHHQKIFKSILSVTSPSIQTVANHLKTTGELDEIGGIFELTRIGGKYINPASIDYAGRVIQQMFIKREIIRISGDAISNAYDDSVDCIHLFENLNEQINQLENIFDPDSLTLSALSTKENELEYLIAAREGTLSTGLSTGTPALDNHFRFKQNSFVICNGHDNVGKTAILVYLAVVANRLHGWKWILACMENQEAQIRKDIIQFVTGKSIQRLTQEEFHAWHDWALHNFHIIKIRDNMTAGKLMKTASKIIKTHPCQGFIIDPYNALDLEKTGDKFFNSHEYHYQVTSKMRAFIKKHNCSIYLNTHAVTEALRAKHKDGDYAGFPMPPEKADTEGGGKFSNRADDFITFHRYVNHPTEFMTTHIHVRKIKDTQTGGRPTPKEEPVKLKMIKGYFGFFDENNKSPLVDTGLTTNHQQTSFGHQEDNPF